MCVYACSSVRRTNRDTVVTQSEVAVLFHIDTDLPCIHPICLSLYRRAHLRSEREKRQDGIWKWTIRDLVSSGFLVPLSARR